MMRSIKRITPEKSFHNEPKKLKNDFQTYLKFSFCTSTFSKGPVCVLILVGGVERTLLRGCLAGWKAKEVIDYKI